MAINKESNVYTFGFSIILVVVVGAILSSLSLGLKPYKDKNAEIKKQMDILNAIGVDADRKSSFDQYSKFVNDSYVIKKVSEVIKDSKVDMKAWLESKNISEDFFLKLNPDFKMSDFVEQEKGDSIVLYFDVEKITSIDAFTLNVQKQHRDKNVSAGDRLLPVFVANKNDTTMYVLPTVGKGLWGPIWGFIAVGDDMTTIVGASFDHKTETPGLGAEINQTFFEEQYIGAKISSNITVVKDGSGKSDAQKVDGITGGTITSKGVEEMMNRTMAVYAAYFSKSKN